MIITTTATPGETIPGIVTVHTEEMGVYCFGFGYYGDRGWKYKYTAAESLPGDVDVEKTINLTLRSDETGGWKVVWFTVLKWNEIEEMWETDEEIYTACLMVVI